MIGKRIEISKHQDIRGLLKSINNIPFEVKRVFFISDVPSDAMRGKHFSKTSQFLYVVVKGSCKVELDNGTEKESHVLNVGDGLQFRKNTWMTLSEFSDDAILCILADTDYRPDDYSDDYNELLRIVRGKNV